VTQRASRIRKPEGAATDQRGGGALWAVPYLREDDRIHIADRLREKAAVRASAAELDRSPSTVDRGIRRHRHPAGGQ
jgi:hypothetical protein